MTRSVTSGTATESGVVGGSEGGVGRALAGDEFDRDGRDSFMASNPLGDGARGWYPVTIVHPKPNSRLKTIGFIEAWVIDGTVNIAGQGLDANNVAGWEYLLRHARREQ